MLTLTAAGRHRRPHSPTLAHADVSLAPGTTARVTLVLSRAGRRLLAAAPRNRLTVSATLGGGTHRLELIG